MKKKTLIAVTALFVASLLSWVAFSPKTTQAGGVSIIKYCSSQPNISECLKQYADASNTNRDNKNGG